MVTCGVCGETANPGSIFCRRCGAELPRRGVPTPDAQTTVLPVVPPADAPSPEPAAPRHQAPAEPPAYQPPSYQPPSYQEPPAQQPPSYQQPGYQQPPPSYQQPTYQPPSYQQLAPRPAYLPPEPASSYSRDYDKDPVFLPADQRPPRSPRNRNGAIAAIIGGVLVLVLVAFGIAIALLSTDNSKTGVAQPVPSTAKPSVSASASPTAPKTSTKPKPTPKPTPKPSVNKVKVAQTAALKSLGSLIGQSGSVRAGIGTALSQINSCKNIPQAVTTLKNASRTRQTLAGQASKLNLSSISSGPQLVATFRASMQASALADDNYAAWGEHVQGCKKSAPSKPALKVAQTYDGRATAAKTTFANQYNAVARTLGLPGTNAGAL